MAVNDTGWLLGRRSHVDRHVEEWRRARKRGASKTAQRFKVGDPASWNSEAGRVSGTIIAVDTKDFGYKGHTHHATEDELQYEIKSDKTDHVAAHKSSALDYA